ncbi:Squamosa promoter-binding-like protein 8 [Cucurbita argyrosperma subsp. argyrosperma]|nr:Squamosa promoter-binding-like protein 8 [Cucurbita argyrosperma subsp. argyrosperma]
MLEYEWGSTNAPPILLPGDESEPAFNPEAPHSHHLPTFMDHHHHNTFLPTLTPPPFTTHFGGFDDHPHSFIMGPSHHYDTVADAVHGGGVGGGEFVVVPKSEEVCRSITAVPVDFAARIGLNLGGRTYFSSEEEEFVNQLYRRARTGGEPGSGNWSARCQAEGCNADLSQAKQYHRRHKVCEFHSKASTVITAGLTQRFCQQCSRFHVLAEFDNGKRSCRKRLADHNRRRRKTQHISNQGSPKTQRLQTTTTSTTSSTEQSAWSVTVAVSPAKMSLECLNQRPY